MKSIALLAILATFWVTSTVADVILAAVKAKNGSLDVSIPNDGKAFNVPADVLTLTTALLNEVTVFVNAAQTKGTANLVFPIYTDFNGLLFTEVGGAQYSTYIGPQLDGIVKALVGFSQMIDAFSFLKY